MENQIVNSQASRQRAAIQRFRNKIRNYPNSEEIVGMAFDFVTNIIPEELNEFEWNHLKEAIVSGFEETNRPAPNYTDDDYKTIYNAFVDLVHEYHNARNLAGGRKRRVHKRKTHKNRKSKKSRKQK